MLQKFISDGCERIYQPVFIDTFDRLKKEMFVASLLMQISREILQQNLS